MKIIIIPEDVSEIIKEMDFPSNNKLEPVKSYLNDKLVEWLPSRIIEEDIFKNSHEYLNNCESIEITEIVDEYTNSDGKIIIPGVETIDGITRLVYRDNGKIIDPNILETRRVIKI